MKSYTKPEIAFVNFGNGNPQFGTPSGVCKINGNFPDANNCNFTIWTGYTVFLVNTVQKCTISPQDDAFGKFCYDVPLADTRVFHS